MYECLEDWMDGHWKENKKQKYKQSNFDDAEKPLYKVKNAGEMFQPNIHYNDDASTYKYEKYKISTKRRSCQLQVQFSFGSSVYPSAD